MADTAFLTAGKAGFPEKSFFGADMLKILITDRIAGEGIDFLRSIDGVEPVIRIGMDEDELAGIIGEHDGLIIRSGTRVTAKVLERPGRLRAVARAGVGVDNVDLEAATKKGILVMNTPGANTLSAAEHTMTLMLAMSRNIVPACNSLKAGRWERKDFTGNQLSGKVLGIIGMGRIGMAVARMASGFNMRLIGYDPLATEADAEKAGIEIMPELEELLQRSDFITLHVPRNAQTLDMIDRPQLALMKPGARIINCARGGVINEGALYDALEQGVVAGAAIDVFKQEPPENRRFEKLENCLVTPHLGASTEEAQIQVAKEAARILVEALREDKVNNAINAPARTGAVSPIIHSYIELARRIGIMASVIAGGRIDDVRAQYRGTIAGHDIEIVTTSFQIGLLSAYFETPVNMVNAPVLARERGIVVEEVKNTEPRNFAAEFGARVSGSSGVTEITGTVLSEKILRIIGINGFDIEMTPADTVMIVFNDDRPGVIGSVGTILGRHGINIQTMGVGQKATEKKAVLAISVDAEPDGKAMEEIRGLDFVNRVYLCRLD